MTTTRKLRWTLVAASLAALILVLAAGLAYGANPATQPAARPGQVATATYQPCDQAGDGWGHDAAAMRQHQQGSEQAQLQCDTTHQQQRDREHARQGMHAGAMSAQEMAEHHPTTYQKSYSE